MTDNVILSAQNVSKQFGGRGDLVARGLARLGLARPRPVVRAVEDVSFDLYKGEVLGVVGESGCGKSTLGRMVAGLLDPSEGQINGRAPDANTGPLPMQMIFQDPFSSLNPRKRVSDLIGEAPRVHRIVSPSEVNAYVADLMDRCGIDASYRDRFSHQFSGGQRQRIGIARALAVKPEILVCDEAVSALDVSIQAQIINLFMDLRDEFGLTYLFISHDLGVVEHIADRILVMYLGRIVESGPAEQIFNDPQHPYTRALIDGVPRLDRRRTVYEPIKGDIPSPIDPPKGCHFHPRCPLAEARCRTERPVLRDIAPGRQAACHLIETTAIEGEPKWPATKTG
ncbi:oligopeptide/dipeptide ABC transporter ATP-binding protein [Marivita sp.]|uniref:ABC transporter ATP-binding protein n=1 Tax=Marivita sp. TaxID=2003365 RepID=UPI0025BBA11F|nr:oligopeptide/dipeptide ABC transporter ATP-binding protein [Marivita sp.]